MSGSENPSARWHPGRIAWTMAHLLNCPIRIVDGLRDARAIRWNPMGMLRPVVAAGGVFLSAVTSALGAAVEASLERGLPVLQSWSSRDYRSHHEVVSAAQGPGGSMFFASLTSVLEFDGQVWSKHLVPGAWIKQVAAGPDGNIYVAGEGEFGRLVLSPDGGRHYESFTSLVPANVGPFGVVRSVIPRADGAYFSSQAGVFRWHEGQLDVWPIEGQRQMYLLADGEELLLTNPAKGLHRFNGIDWPVVSNAPEFQRNPRAALTRMRDGRRVLSLFREGLFEYENGQIKPWPNAAAAQLKEALVTDVLGLPDGRLAVGTAQGGVLFLGEKGQLLDRFEQKRGLNNDTVFDVAAERDGALWFSTRNGVARWDPSLGVTRFDTHLGLPEASVQDLLRHRGELFATMTGVGLFRLRPATNVADTARFESVPLPYGTTYRAASHPSGLLVGTDRGLALWDGRAARLVAQPEGNVKQVLTWPSDPKVVFTGTESGIQAFEANAEEWKPLGQWPTGGEVLKLAGDADGAVWAGIGARGFLRIPAPANARAWAGQEPTLFDQARGLTGQPSYFQPEASPVGVLLLSDRGAFRYEPSRNRIVVEDRFGIGKDSPVIFGYQHASADGALWGSATRVGATDIYAAEWPFGCFRPVADGSFVWQRTPASWKTLIGPQGPFAMRAEGSGLESALWVATESALLRIAPALPEVLRREFSVTLRGPVVGDEVVPPQKGVSRIKPSQESISFEFATARLDLGAEVQFETRLVGLNDRWSPPSSNRRVDYAGLTGGPFTFEVRAVDADGNYSEPVQATFTIAAPWYRAGRALAGYGMLVLLALQGFTRWRVSRVEARRRELEETVTARTRELAEARDSAESANRAKSRFLANMSHELRTPLHGLLGFAQLIHRDLSLSAQNRERLRLIQTSGDHLLGLINDVLDLAKVEAGRVELKNAPFDLGGMLRDLEASFSPRIVQRGLKFELGGKSRPDGFAVGDVQRLRQVLENLLGNALKFTSQGLIRFEVERLPAANPAEGAENPLVRFAVIDTGVGISAEDLERLFQPFTQASAGRPAESGVGLGLAISQHLIGLMGGKIEVSSEPGKGSRFEFTIALPPVVAPPAPEPAAPVTGYSGSRRTVMVVDDVETNRKLIRDFLEPLGFGVTEAESGEVALEALKPGTPPPELVVLDLRMPGMDGFELTRRIRALALKPPPKIVATSASTFAFTPEDAAELGCDGFLPKPFKEIDLLDVLHRALELEWTSPANKESDAAESAEAGGVLPPQFGAEPTPPAVPPVPRELLEPLLAAANTGDIANLRIELTAFRAAAPDHTQLADELENLIQTFQIAVLRERIEYLLTGGT